MEIAEALRTCAAQTGWSATKLAAEVGRGELSAKMWMSGKALPSADVLILLQRRLPGFQKALGLGPAPIDATPTSAAA